MALSTTVTILVIAGIFVVVAFATFLVTFLCCVFCPFCVIPTIKKQRHERASTGRRNNDTELPHVMIEVQNAHNNTQPTSAVRSSVRHPQQQPLTRAQTQGRSDSIPMTTLSSSNDPPPPYPGMQGQVSYANLPYNPHYPGEQNSSETPTAPIPSPTPRR